MNENWASAERYKARLQSIYEIMTTHSSEGINPTSDINNSVKQDYHMINPVMKSATSSCRCSTCSVRSKDLCAKDNVNFYKLGPLRVWGGFPLFVKFSS
tara:strand:+ start:502 stop:798 length:297 start_codon:yes stop_codon:yes gene_type:complete